MRTKDLCMIFACTLTGFTMNAQINIGTFQEPHRGAVLHLRTSTRLNSDSLGMKLTVTALPDTAKLYLGTSGSSIYHLDVDETATGMIVYNLTERPCGGLTKCLYIWNGGNWIPLGCPVPTCDSVPEVGAIDCPIVLNRISTHKHKPQ
ncbi:MAG: hypothetical protein LBR66_01265 [Candidatus Symbiothrix sp.]|jgi:hypothetical protein|nr:hypothetical protein [Candidatus Symbiothrix sp.]